MAFAGIAASVRADSCTGRRISIDGALPEDRETIALLFEILGWQVVFAGPYAARSHCAGLYRASHQGASHQGCSCQGSSCQGSSRTAKPADSDTGSPARALSGSPDGAALVRAGARLMVTRNGAILHVGTDDPQLARQLAANGLDRLVTPVSVAVLEQLCLFAS